MTSISTSHYHAHSSDHAHRSDHHRESHKDERSSGEKIHSPDAKTAHVRHAHRQHRPDHADHAHNAEKSHHATKHQSDYYEKPSLDIAKSVSLSVSTASAETDANVPQSAASGDEKTALAAQRSAGYSLKIRTQEGDLVKLSLQTAESLQIGESGTGEDGTPLHDFTLDSSAHLNLRVYGDLNDSELTAIRAVFEEAAAVAREFFDGDLAAALDSAQSIEFDAAQIAKIRLLFHSRTQLSASYAPGTSEPTEPATPLEAPVSPAAPDTTDATETTENAAESAADTEATPAAPSDSAPASDPTAAPDANTDTAVADADQALTDALEEFVAAITAYLSSLIPDLDKLQANPSGDEETGYRLVTAFKLDVLEATLLASAPEAQTEVAAEAVNAIETAVAEPLA